MKKYGFGVDIGGTTCKIGLFETSGKMLDKWEIPTNKADNGGHILDDVAASIDEKMKSASIAKEDVEGIGVGVPGPVLEDGSVSVCVNLGWGQVQVADELSSKTGLPVKVGNDANVAALGEMWLGAGKGEKNIVMAGRWKRLHRSRYGYAWNRCWRRNHSQWQNYSGSKRSGRRNWTYYR